MPLQPFRVLSKKTVLNEPYCRVDQHKVELPNGQEGDWFIKVSNDAVVVLPFLVSGGVLLQKTYKHGASAIIVETCAGLVDDNESPEAAAHRELLEETGYQASEMKLLGSVYANPTGSNMRYHFFCAKGCKHVAKQDLDDAEQIENIIFKDLHAAKKYLQQADITTSAATRAILSYI